MIVWINAVLRCIFVTLSHAFENQQIHLFSVAGRLFHLHPACISLQLILRTMNQILRCSVGLGCSANVFCLIKGRGASGQAEVQWGERLCCQGSKERGGGARSDRSRHATALNQNKYREATQCTQNQQDPESMQRLALNCLCPLFSAALFKICATGQSPAFS